MENSLANTKKAGKKNPKKKTTNPLLKLLSFTDSPSPPVLYFPQGSFLSFSSCVLEKKKKNKHVPMRDLSWTPGIHQEGNEE
jgi:hypothetical protein